MQMNAPVDAIAAWNLPLVETRARSIGDILVESGRLDAESAARVAVTQRDRGLRFGEAAISLGLASVADIEFALARQFEYPYLKAGDSGIDASVMVAYRPFGPVAEQMRSLRTALMVNLLRRPEAPRTVAVLSSARGEGRSFIAANLAVVFSQLGERTLLIDADLRHPGQHRLFGLGERQGLSNLLLGRVGLECIARVPQFRSLSVLGAGSQAPNPQELLAGPRLSQLLERAAAQFDVVIVDTPAAGETADGQIVASRTGAGLLVTRRGRTLARPLQQLRRSLRDSGASVLGTVLNDG